MGLALDEQDNSKRKPESLNGIPVVVDDYLQTYLETSPGLTIDYHDLPYETGFVIYGGSTC